MSILQKGGTGARKRNGIERLHFASWNIENLIGKPLELAKILHLSDRC